MKNQSRTWLRPISLAGSSSVAAVRKLRGAQPARRLPIEARLSADVARAVPGRELADEGAEERIVVARRQHRGDERIPDRKDHRADQRVPSAIDSDPADH